MVQDVGKEKPNLILPCPFPLGLQMWEDRSFSYECGWKVHQHQRYCIDKANNEDSTKKEKHTDINKEQVIPHRCYCKDKANKEDTTKKKNPSLCAYISVSIVLTTLCVLYSVFINRKH